MQLVKVLCRGMEEKWCVKVEWNWDTGVLVE